MPGTALSTSFVFSHLVNIRINSKEIFEIVAAVVSILLMRKLSCQFYCISVYIILIFYNEAVFVQNV